MSLWRTRPVPEARLQTRLAVAGYIAVLAAPVLIGLPFSAIAWLMGLAGLAPGLAEALTAMAGLLFWGLIVTVPSGLLAIPLARRALGRGTAGPLAALAGGAGVAMIVALMVILPMRFADPLGLYLSALVAGGFYGLLFWAGARWEDRRRGSDVLRT